MKDEIRAAVSFLTRLIGKNEKLDSTKLQVFQTRLAALLWQRFENHWFPEQPFKGQGYRCIRLNEMDRRDPVLEAAAQQSGLNYHDLHLPTEITIWVDPLEVCCRFGEHRGSYCTVASFKSGNQENYMDVINFDEIESKSREQAKKSSLDILVGRRQCTYHRCCEQPPADDEQNGNKLNVTVRPNVRNDRYHWVKKSVVQT